MTEANKQTAESTPARDAGRTKPNLVTSETIAQMYSSPAAASEQDSKESPKEETKVEAQAEDQRKDGKKNGVQERISELVNRRKEAEAKAEAAERARQELEDRLKRLEARPEAIEEKPRPQRAAFSTQEEYEDAVIEWKADQKIAQRERQAAEARAKAEQEALQSEWAKRQKRAMAEIEDYTEVIGKSEVALPGHIHQAILESEMGPYLAYYFARHPDEAHKFAAMTPTTALRRLGKLEDELADVEEEPKKPAVEVSKAPPPVKPVRDAAPVTSTPKNFEDYRAKRRAEMGR